MLRKDCSLLRLSICLLFSNIFWTNVFLTGWCTKAMIVSWNIQRPVSKTSRTTWPKSWLQPWRGIWLNDAIIRKTGRSSSNSSAVSYRKTKSFHRFTSAVISTLRWSDWPLRWDRTDTYRPPVVPITSSKTVFSVTWRPYAVKVTNSSGRRFSAMWSVHFLCCLPGHFTKIIQPKFIN